METPSSTRRITRSQTKASSSNTSRIKTEESTQKGVKQDRSVLIDITNDSPIVGLASGRMNSSTPMSKQRSYRQQQRTPGSGEALLRGQVKNLLQKVEEEADISMFSLDSSGGCRGLGHGLKGLMNSPAGLVAPTPANTPQVLNFSSAVDEFLSSVFESPIEDHLTVSQVVSGIFDVKKQPENELESEKDLISRTLFLDFAERSDSSSDCSSVVTMEKGSNEQSPLKDDDDASIWSIQVNASTRDDEEDEDEVIQDDNEEYCDEVGEEEVVDQLHLDELCEGMRNINVNGMGKHTRFVYNSDDELVDVDEECAAEVLRLKGLPTPIGKHLRFQDDEDE